MAWKAIAPSAVASILWHSPKIAVLAILATAILSWLFYLLILAPNYLSSTRNLPSPPIDSYLFGSVFKIFRGEAGEAHLGWKKQLGAVYRYRLFFGQMRVFVSDPAALNHVLLLHSYSYPKPKELRGELGRILGKGVLFAEGDVHKRQRRVMAMPFTQAQVNTYLPVFQEISDKLRANIARILDASEGTSESGNGWKVIDMAPWMSRTTLDVIGRTGFAYDFGALDRDDSELAKAFSDMFTNRQPGLRLILLFFLARMFPFLAKLPTEQSKKVKRSMSIMEREGKGMLAERKKWSESGELDERTDLLSLIYKANLKESSKRDKLYDDEIMGQISTFILAGYETSSTSLSWILMTLSKNIASQDKLRSEVREAKASATADGQASLSVEQLNSLPYLDAVIREVLRVCPPVYGTMRSAAHDDVIPLSQPVIGKDGKTITHISVKKGQSMYLGIHAFNMSPDLFGEDVVSYRPERWLDGTLDEKLRSARGFTAWSSQLTFLGGPRGCIGYKFAILEIKTILATLIDSFEFAERDEAGTAFSRRSAIVTRPYLKGHEDDGPQLPLRVRTAA